MWKMLDQTWRKAYNDRYGWRFEFTQGGMSYYFIYRLYVYLINPFWNAILLFSIVSPG